MTLNKGNSPRIASSSVAPVSFVNSPALADLIAWAIVQLSQSESARLDAEVLLAYVLDRPRSYLRAWPEKTLSGPQLQQYWQLIDRRAAGEPVAYLTGTREFWSMELKVNRDTLIPRPETETLVELALDRIPTAAKWRIADLGTGSGAVAIAIARERPCCNVIATDHSAETLAIARGNSRLVGADRLRFVVGDWCNPLGTRTLEMILCNPPYVAEGDPHLAGSGVRFEPYNALASGPDGLRDLRKLIQQAIQVLRPGGWLLLEHGYQQDAAVKELLIAGGYENIKGYIDSGGNPRVTVCRTPSQQSPQ